MLPFQEGCDRIVQIRRQADHGLTASNICRSDPGQGFKECIILMQAHHHLFHRQIAQHIILPPQMEVVQIHFVKCLGLVEIAGNGLNQSHNVFFFLLQFAPLDK